MVIFADMKTLKELLEEEDLINKASLARKIWENNKNASVMLSHKLAGKQIKNSAMRVTEADEAKAKQVIGEFGKRMIEYARSK